MYRFLKYPIFLVLFQALPFLLHAPIWADNLFGSLQDLTNQGDNICSIPISSRAAVLGWSDTSTAPGTEGLYTNPAGLDSGWSADIQTSYVNLLEQTYYHFLGFRIPLYSNLSFGAGWGRLQSNNFEARDNNDQYLGLFSHQANAVNIGLGMRIDPALRVGASLHYYFQSVADFQNSGMGLNLGAIWNGENWGLGLALQDVLAMQFTPDFGVRGAPGLSADFLDTNLYCGAHWHPHMTSPWLEQITFYGGISWPKLQTSFLAYQGFWHTLSLGLEYGLGPTPIKLRVGGNAQHLAYGLSVEYNRWRLEYTFDQRLGAPLHWFSWLWATGLPNPEPNQVKNQIKEQASAPIAEPNEDRIEEVLPLPNKKDFPAELPDPLQNRRSRARHE
jgi:hypothetical protein